MSNRLWRYYSGPKSRLFWNRVNAIGDVETRFDLYDLGCRLQEFEVKVLNKLKLAEESRTAAPAPQTEQPVDPTGQGRVLLNAYGRQCWDAGYAAAKDHAERDARIATMREQVAAASERITQAERGMAAPAQPQEAERATCQECGCRTGGARFCFEHAPYMTYPKADGTFLVDRNGRQWVTLIPEPSITGQLEAEVARLSTENAEMKETIRALGGQPDASVALPRRSEG